MFNRLSVLRLFFVIFVTSFFYCGMGFCEVFSATGNSTGSNFFRGHGSSNAFRGRSGASDSSSFMRRSGYAGEQSRTKRLDSLDPYVSRSEGVDYVRMGSQFGQPGQFGRLDRLGRLDGSLSGSSYLDDRLGYRLPALDRRLGNLRESGLDYYDDPGVSVRSLPHVTDDLSRRVDRLAQREQMLEESIVLEKQSYSKLDKFMVPGVDSEVNADVNLDVNYTGDAPSDAELKRKAVSDSLAITESEQILKPLSPDEIRQELDEMRGKKSLGTEEVDELDKFDVDVNETDAADDKAAADSEHMHVNVNSKRSKELLEAAENFEKHADKKFKVYIKIADKFLQDGEYYNAKDAYEIAGVWKTNDSRALAGKAYAHLAAGEYMSSSLYLMRAMDASGDYAGKRVDVPRMIGNKKLYDKRVGEVKVMYEAGGFYKMAFLYAYLSCQNGDLEMAKECIDSAGSRLRETEGWKALKGTIEQRLAISDKQ